MKTEEPGKLIWDLGSDPPRKLLFRSAAHGADSGLVLSSKQTVKQ
jgi:hypothetical protein